MPGLLLDQDLPSRNSLTLGQVLSMVITMEKLAWFSSTMATMISRSKWEIESPQLILEKIDTPPVEEVQGLDDTIRGSGGFGSTGVKSRNNTGRNSEEKETNGENERIGEDKNESEDKNETLKGSIRGSRMRAVKKTKIEGSSRLSRERQIISVKQLKKLVKKENTSLLGGGLGTRK